MKKRKYFFLLIFISILFFIWGYRVFYINNIYNNHHHIVSIDADQTVEIDGLIIDEVKSRIYDPAALIDEYNDLSEYYLESTERMELGEYKIIVTQLSLTNTSDKSMNMADGDISFVGFVSGAWYNGPTLEGQLLGTLYPEKSGIIDPGETEEYVIMTEIWQKRVEKKYWNQLDKFPVSYIVIKQDDTNFTEYHCYLKETEYVAATKQQDDNFKKKQQDFAKNESKQQEEELDSSAQSLLLEDTTDHITEMGNEYVIEGIGYTVTKAIITDDLEQVPEYANNIDGWCFGEIPITFDTTYYDGCKYIFLEYIITNYTDYEYTINTTDKNLLEVHGYWNENGKISEDIITQSREYFDKSQNKPTSKDGIGNVGGDFSQYTLQPGETLQATFGSQILESANKPFITENTIIYLITPYQSRRVGYENEWTGEKNTVYYLNKIEYKFTQGGEKQE